MYGNMLFSYLYDICYNAGPYIPSLKPDCPLNLGLLKFLIPNCL